jgi:hypothetical protein
VKHLPLLLSSGGCLALAVLLSLFVRGKPGGSAVKFVVEKLVCNILLWTGVISLVLYIVRWYGLL